MAEHLLVVAYPHLVKFFGVVGINGEEFDPFVKGEGIVHGFLQYPEIEREPADIPVGVFVFAHMKRSIYKCNDSL
jgi:hypothetical protein